MLWDPTGSGWGAAFGLTGGCGGVRRVGSSAGDLTRNRSKQVKRKGEHILFGAAMGVTTPLTA